jgi:excinuclease ABC subunit C
MTKMSYKNELVKKVKELPKRPGVYKFLNETSGIIYIGKAKSLRDRVKSYFALDIPQGSKTAALVRQIRDLEFIEVASELEALILEAELIKQHKPKYNIQLKDDKSALYIVIRNELVKLNGAPIKVPKVLTARESDLKQDDTIFGPYPHARIAKYVVRAVRKMIPYRDCAPSKFQRYNKLDKPCFYGHIGLCSAPCLANNSIDGYKKDIKKIEKLLRGDSPSVVKSLEVEMKKLSKEMLYEEAAVKRDLIEKIKYVTKQFNDPNAYIENPYLIEDQIADSLDQLTEAIPYLKNSPNRIECYDISTSSGKESTGSMVVATDGRLDNKQYRRFKIKTKETPDDYEMMREVLRRRFKREKSEAKNLKKWGYPDLLVMDGGKGQVSAALEVLKDLNLDIPVIGLAKRFETIVLRDFEEVLLDKNNEGLKLLQRLRDEAHRFANSYRMKLRLEKLKR